MPRAAMPPPVLCRLGPRHRRDLAPTLHERHRERESNYSAPALALARKLSRMPRVDDGANRLLQECFVGLYCESTELAREFAPSNP
jgi:hypothetical protein